MTLYRKGSVIKSTTGQLTWDVSDKGFFTVNTAGTKAGRRFHRRQESRRGAM